jgi:hypothetical protein
MRGAASMTILLYVIHSVLFCHVRLHPLSEGLSPSGLPSIVLL